MGGVPEERQFEAGEVLFREGDTGKHLFVLRSGRVHLTRQVGSEPTLLQELRAGDFTGEVSVMGNQPHHTTATAVEATRCLAIGAKSLETMVTSNDEIAVRLIRGLVHHLSSAYETISRVGHRDPFTRVVAALVRHAKISKESGDDGVWVRRKLRDIGSEIALAEKELGEVSKQLMRTKLVRIRKEGILIADIDKLHALLESKTDGNG